MCAAKYTVMLSCIRSHTIATGTHANPPASSQIRLCRQTVELLKAHGVFDKRHNISLIESPGCGVEYIVRTCLCDMANLNSLGCKIPNDLWTLVRGGRLTFIIRSKDSDCERLKRIQMKPDLSGLSIQSCELCSSASPGIVYARVP